MTVRRQLAQQEEYRVRDTESREPRTEAGRRMLVGLLDYDALPPDRMGWNRDAILAIEAEAALLAPDGGLRKAAAAMFDQHGNFVSTGAHVHLLRKALAREAALLARRAPGDRERLREALGTIVQITDGLRPFGPLVVNYREEIFNVATAALAADSRPEQPAPETRQPHHFDMYGHQPGCGVCADLHAVRPEEPPE